MSHNSQQNYHGINSDQYGIDSAKLFKQFDIPVDSQTTLKHLKEIYIANINEYQQISKEYQQKIQTLSVLLSKIEFQDNFRSIQDLQGLFHYCRDKIVLTEKHINVEQLYYQNKRQIELKTIELSQFKAKCKKQEDLLRKLQDENRDLRRAVLAGIEERTAMFKHSQTEQSKISSMQVKVDGLEQGLLTLSGDNQVNNNNNNNNNGNIVVVQNNNQNGKHSNSQQSTVVGYDNQRQNRLKTTIHVLIMENNTLKKELSFMKNQNDEQIEEINRLKKKINHLVMKIDEQNKKYAQQQYQQMYLQQNYSQHNNNHQHSRHGYLSDQEILEQDQELENSGLQEFEKLKDKHNHQDSDILDSPIEKLSPSQNLEDEIHQQQQQQQQQQEINKNPRKSTFNLQGPYWKNRTNDILKHDKRLRLNKLDSYDGKQLKALQIPSLMTRDGREKRQGYDFRFDFIHHEDEIGILKEINQMGIHNYIETTMSLKSLEIKKNIELVTREYVINNTIRRVYEFINGQIIDYIMHHDNRGDLGKLITGVNRGMLKLLNGGQSQSHGSNLNNNDINQSSNTNSNVKEFKVWVRDTLNNYLWTYNQDACYEQYDLSQSTQGQMLINLKESQFNKFKEQDQTNSLLVPLLNINTDLNCGIVQVICSTENIGNISDISRIQYEIQVASTIISEVITSMLSREQQNRVQYYYIGNQVQVQKTLFNMLNQDTKLQLYKAFEKDIKQVFDISKLRFAFISQENPQLLWNYTIQTDTNNNHQQKQQEQIYYYYQELDFTKNPSLMSITLQKNQSLIFFMPYQHLQFDSRLDLDTTLPLNSIIMKSPIGGETIGVLQFENKQVKNRNEHESRLKDQMVSSMSDEGILSVVRQISSILYVCLQKILKQ